MFKLFGMLFLVPTSVLFAISFFVMYAMTKTEDKGLKLCGWLTSILLWIAALVVFSSGLFVSINGGHMMKKGCPMMGGKMGGKMMMGDKKPCGNMGAAVSGEAMPMGRGMMRMQGKMKHAK